MRKQCNINPSELYFSASELSKNVKYVKLIYMDLDEEIHEIDTKVKFIGDRLISLYYTTEELFDITYPQEIGLKFITDNALYAATAILQEMKRTDNKIFFTILSPQKMIKRQDRKYERVDIERPCVIVMTDDKGFSTTYLSKSINLSACGILLHEPETMLSDKIVDVKMSIYDCYHIVIFLEKDLVLKQFARFVREEHQKCSHGYAFQFMSMSPENTEIICQYIDQELINQKRLMPAK